uniref:Uncharacterized protein n=1 Tax=Hyaloperonospora arabidopsidis (strain Emoy2) TaxID=559515 RepID=M4C0Z0_HYAAE
MVTTERSHGWTRIYDRDQRCGRRDRYDSYKAKDLDCGRRGSSIAEFGCGRWAWALSMTNGLKFCWILELRFQQLPKRSLEDCDCNDKQIDVQFIGKSKVFTTSRATVKINLEWEVVYEFEVRIMPHHAGVDLILGTDFMIPAGIRLDLFNATAKLPDEIAIPLLRSVREVDESTHGDEVIGGPTESIDIESLLFEEFQLQSKQPEASIHELLIRRLPALVPTIVYNR